MGIAVPDEKSPDGQANLDKLTGLSGSAFDKAFKEAMIDSHNKGIAKNEKQAASGDAQTAALAKETLPSCASIWRRRKRCSAPCLRRREPSIGPAAGAPAATLPSRPVFERQPEGRRHGARQRSAKKRD